MGVLLLLVFAVVGTTAEKCVNYPSRGSTKVETTRECEEKAYPGIFLASGVAREVESRREVRTFVEGAPMWWECPEEAGPPPMVELPNATADGNGVVFLGEDTCETVDHSACIDQTTPRDEFPKNCAAYETAVSLSTQYGRAYYHLVVNIGLGLAALGDDPDAFVRDHPGVVFQLRHDVGMPHGAGRREYALQWFDILGWGSVVRDRMVFDPCVRARNLLLPELGDCGGFLRPFHVHWLQDRVRQYLADEHVRHNLTTTTPGPGKTRLLLVTRTVSRVPGFWPKLRAYLESHPGDFDIDDFDDSTDLGTVPQQLARFAQADVIVAPHGAGLVNMVAARPSTCVLEFIPDYHFNTCFINLGGRSFNLTYNAMLYGHHRNAEPNITFVDQSLRRCALHRQQSSVPLEPMKKLNSM